MSLINTMLKDLELRRRHQGPPRGMLRYEQLSLPAVRPERHVSAGWWVLLFMTVLLASVALVAGVVAAWVVTQREHTPRGADTAVEQKLVPQLPQVPIATQALAPAPGAPAPSPTVAFPNEPSTASKPSPTVSLAAIAPAPQPVVSVDATPALLREAALADPGRTSGTPTPAAAPTPARTATASSVAGASTTSLPAAATPRAAPSPSPSPALRPDSKRLVPSTTTGGTDQTQLESQDAQADRSYTKALEQQRQGQLALAMESLKQALQANPKQAPARLLLARLLTEGKQPAAAADLLADGLMLLPRQTAFARELAPLWIQAGQQEDAMALLAQSTRNASNSDPRLHAYYASQLLRLARPAEAETHYRAALLGEPEQGEWLVGLGLSLQQLGRQPEAMEAFRRASSGGRLPPQVKTMVDQILAKLQAQTP